MAKPVRRGAARFSAVLVIAALAVTIPTVETAFAAAPTVSSFNPTSGPIGTSVQISGTGFNDSSVATAVTFNGTTATFTVDSNVQITATVPAGATDGPIAVTDSEGTATSASSFDVTPSPVPTITSFNPTSGPVGTSVVITGTGFTGATAVKFSGTTATTFTVNSNTQISATVPTGAATGPIAVTTPGGTATSASNFTVTGGVTKHERRISLQLCRHLVARGRVTATDGFNACESSMKVKIQRRRLGGGWGTVGTDQTNADGLYRERIPDRVGVYRAVAVRETVNGGNDVCLPDRSPRVRHHH